MCKIVLKESHSTSFSNARYLKSFSRHIQTGGKISPGALEEVVTAIGALKGSLGISGCISPVGGDGAGVATGRTQQALSPPHVLIVLQ